MFTFLHFPISAPPSLPPISSPDRSGTVTSVSKVVAAAAAAAGSSLLSSSRSGGWVRQRLSQPIFLPFHTAARMQRGPRQSVRARPREHGPTNPPPVRRMFQSAPLSRRQSADTSSANAPSADLTNTGLAEEKARSSSLRFRGREKRDSAGGPVVGGRQKKGEDSKVESKRQSSGGQRRF